MSATWFKLPGLGAAVTARIFFPLFSARRVTARLASFWHYWRCANCREAGEHWRTLLGRFSDGGV